MSLRPTKRVLLRGLLSSPFAFGALLNMGFGPAGFAQVKFPRPPPGTGRSIKKVGEAIKSYIDLNEAAQAVVDGKEPPTGTASGKELAAQLKDLKKELAAYEPPAFRIRLLKLGALPTSDLEQTRRYLEPFGDNLLDAVFDYEDSEAAYGAELEDAEAGVQQLSVTAGLVEDVLKKLVEVVFLPQPKLQAAKAWLDMSEVAQPLIGDCEAIVRSKKAASKSYFAQRREDLRSHSKSILSALAVEQAALAGEAARLQALKDALAKTQAAFDAEEEDLDRLARQIEAREQDIRQQGDLLEEQDRRLADVQSQRNLLSAEAENRSRWLQTWKANWRCSKGFSWQDCTSHQAQKTDYLRNEVAPRQQQHAQMVNELAELGRENLEIQRAIQETKALLDEYRRRLKQEESRYSTLAHDHSLAESELKAEVEAVNKEVWTSRADLFASASRGDSAAISTAIGALK